MNAQQLKNSILQRAIEGKLVPQRAEEGNAADLLREIKAEKARLVKEGKIKKEKPLPEIKAEEIPFEIPESWVWVRLGEISTFGNSKQKIVPRDITPEMWTLDMEDIEKDSGRIVRTEYAKNRTIAGEKIVFHQGDILYSKLRPYLKKILIAPADGICTSELVPFQCYGNINAAYITSYLRSAYVTQKVNAASYGVKMPRVSKDTMLSLLVSLPPLAEQKRIVAKLEQLRPLVEQYARACADLAALITKQR
ncbi:MAG: restriction endonuclease subunit S [Schwartzia sp.]|nr:restriction endonuclease subunit S [Schwartzia sp. (in: firmicutes)]